MSLSGKVALVTGASAGIGAAVAQALAEAGARVLLADIDEAGLRRVQSGIGDEQAQFRRTDVSSGPTWWRCHRRSTPRATRR